MPRPATPRPTRQQLADARDRRLPDVIGPGLDVLFCGINPSLWSAAVGHHFANPGNRFWPTLHRAGFTDRRLAPHEDIRLPEFGCGVTNLVDRATARADELDDHELRTGARRLRAKVGRYRPACLAIVGITAYRTAFDRPHARVGRQDHRIGDTLVWVLPNPSGLNAHYQLPDLARVFAELRRAVPRGP